MPDPTAPSGGAALATLEPADLVAVMRSFADGLAAHREGINRLNVYPVPDGDTGTNMALTLRSVAEEIDGSGAHDLAGVCTAISHGSLMGARGNSGVILSQILRGMADVLREHEVIDAPTFAAALTRAAELAYEAVMRPVEGTILTVIRCAAEGSATAAQADADLRVVVEASLAAGHVALADTPNQLPVLKDAGVVDAGGTGLLLLLDAVLHVVDGREMPVAADLGPDGVAALADLAATAHDEHGHGGDGVADLRYEVMFFLEAPDATIAAFKDVWAGIGDSIVVVGGDGLWNCHIHCDDIGAAVEAAIDCGRPRNIRVTDLLEQVEEERWVREAEVEPEEPSHSADPVTTAIVAVATGAGVSRIFYSLGVQKVVKGGQTMNPSTAQLLEAVEAAPAEEVLILPNNKNIVAVAEQVDAQTAKKVRVVRTTGAAEGFASLLAYDPEADADTNHAAMALAADAVVAGEVTQAVRDSSCEVGPIREGDWLGVADDGIRSVAPALDAAATQLLSALVTADHEIVTIIEGEGSSSATTRHLKVWLEEHRPNVETELHHGGQPLYPYLFGIE